MADHGRAIFLSQTSQTSDEHSSAHSLQNFTTLSGGVGGGEPVSTTKKPRGRPVGSRNKPKPPVVITQDDDQQSLKPVIIEISAGADVMERLIQFARRRQVGITVLSGSGLLSSITLRHTIPLFPAFILPGPFSLLSLSGTFISSFPFPSPSSSSQSSPSAVPDCCSLNIGVSGSHGQVIGGIVGGKVVAASVVTVIVTTFKNIAFYKLLSNEDDDDKDENNNEPKLSAKASEGSGNNNGLPTANPNCHLNVMNPANY